MRQRCESALVRENEAFGEDFPRHVSVFSEKIDQKVDLQAFERKHGSILIFDWNPLRERHDRDLKSLLLDGT
jgi:hypothetical protein